jgi:hypothetical protein
MKYNVVIIEKHNQCVKVFNWAREHGCPWDDGYEYITATIFKWRDECCRTKRSMKKPRASRTQRSPIRSQGCDHKQTAVLLNEDDLKVKSWYGHNQICQSDEMRYLHAAVRIFSELTANEGFN